MRPSLRVKGRELGGVGTSWRLDQLISAFLPGWSFLVLGACYETGSPMRAATRPRPAHTAKVRGTDQRSRKISTSAAAVMSRGTGRRLASSGSSSCSGPQLQGWLVANRVWTAKYRARLAITPTTAAVMLVRAAERLWLPRSRST